MLLYIKKDVLSLIMINHFKLVKKFELKINLIKTASLKLYKYII